MFFADKLTEICEYYNFDGYLLNIECEVENVQKLIEF